VNNARWNMSSAIRVSPLCILSVLAAVGTACDWRAWLLLVDALKADGVTPDNAELKIAIAHACTSAATNPANELPSGLCPQRAFRLTE